MSIALAAPSAFAQQSHTQQDPALERVRREQQNIDRMTQNNSRRFENGDRQAWLRSMDNLVKLRAKLAEAWQTMGMSPQGAKLVADAYDPEWAAHLHRTSLRGKSGQEIAQLLQAAVREKRYLAADQMLIEYQQQKLSIPESGNPRTMD